MKITNMGNGRIAIDSPYNPDFVKKIKAAGSRWNGAAWETDERNIETVRSIMCQVYGRDDRPTETVTVKVTLSQGISEWRGPVILFGRNIASARGRDSGARVGDGVSFKAGGCDSGGSVKNWRTTIDDGSVFIIYDLPKLAVEQRLGWEDEYGTFEIIAPKDPLAALKIEKEALLKRLAEIEELLARE